MDEDDYKVYLGLSDSQKVREFTEQSSGKECPSQPEPMDANEVKFIIRMVLSEMVELAQTVTTNSTEAVKFVKECMGADVKQNYKPPNLQDPEYKAMMCAEQYDAMVDAYYYMLNAACKKGVNLSNIFDVVHAANMNKRWPDGTFHRREDGKIIKNPDWKEPDVKGEIKRQISEGAWLDRFTRTL